MFKQFQDSFMKNFLHTLSRHLPDRRKAFINSVSTNQGRLFYLDDSEIYAKTVFADDNVSEEYKINKCYKIDNRALKEITLWSIDGSFVPTGRPLSMVYSKKCDCAFGFENFVGFVEFKVNADPSAHPLTIQKNRETACEQIRQTIFFIKDALGLVDLKIEGYTFEAYICTPPTYPKKNTAIADLAIEFLETHKIGLFEASEKICD
jgi:hypothetical protein